MSKHLFSDEQVISYIDRLCKAQGNKLGLVAYSPYAREKNFKEMRKIIKEITTQIKNKPEQP